MFTNTHRGANGLSLDVVAKPSTSLDAGASVVWSMTPWTLLDAADAFVETDRFQDFKAIGLIALLTVVVIRLWWDRQKPGGMG